MWQWVASAPACAYEDQLSLGVGAGYAYAARQGGPHHGAAFDLEASLGLGATWSARGTLGYSLHPSDNSLSHLQLGAEVVYQIDVLELVPNIGLGLDVLGSRSHERPHDTRVDLGAHPVLGVDWLVRRELVLGLSARPVFVLSHGVHEPLYLTVSLTASWLLDL
jgi:hypothetical protein